AAAALKKGKTPWLEDDVKKRERGSREVSAASKRGRLSLCCWVPRERGRIEMKRRSSVWRQRWKALAACKEARQESGKAKRRPMRIGANFSASAAKKRRSPPFLEFADKFMNSPDSGLELAGDEE
ncbi:hypothetical protein LINGRAHAP2_LOCUS27829, partial [Linum grandiflorum]